MKAIVTRLLRMRPAPPPSSMASSLPSSPSASSSDSAGLNTLFNNAKTELTK